MKTYHRPCRTLLAAFLAVVMLFSLMPTAFAAQEDNYLDGEIVLDSLTQLGYNAHFESKEKYFWIEEVKIGTYTFSSNIILYGGTMLYRYAQSKGYDTTQGGMAVREYADYEQISGYAMEAMTWAVNTGLISGTSTTTLSPQGEATRAQVATILMRFIETGI